MDTSRFIPHLQLQYRRSQQRKWAFFKAGHSYQHIYVYSFSRCFYPKRLTNENNRRRI